MEGGPAIKEFSDINQEIKQEERISTATPEGEDPNERSLCKEMVDTMIPTGKKNASLELDESVAATSEKPEESIVGPKNPHLPEHGGEKALSTLEEKACEESALTDAAVVSLSDLIKQPVTEKLQQAATHTIEMKDPIDTELELQAEEAEIAKAEEAKTDEERDEHDADADEDKRLSPEHDTLVIVESSKDIDVKAHHKKSHNILSGVGSKVKHSISKVKRAITGKSSHPKTVSKEN